MTYRKLSLAVVATAALALGAMAQHDHKNQSNHNSHSNHSQARSNHSQARSNHSQPASSHSSPASRRSVSHQNGSSSSSFSQHSTSSFSHGSGNGTHRHSSKPFGTSTQSTQDHGSFQRTNTSASWRSNGSHHNRNGQGSGFGNSSQHLTGNHTGSRTLNPSVTRPPSSGHSSFTPHASVAIRAGINAPSRGSFVNPRAPITSHNYPHPHYGNTYIVNNVTVINNNYHYDAAHYSPHVVNFYGGQSSSWGDHWRYGCVERPGIHVSFGFGFYVYTPFYAACVASPWYAYEGVPAYIPCDRVVVYNGYSCNWSEGYAYSYTSGDDGDLNHAVHEISDAFNQGNPDAIDDLIGDTKIGIFRQGHYEYSLEPGDFRAMFADNCHATQTESFRINGVHMIPGGRALVSATHVFQTSDGGTQAVYQRYRLLFEDGRYVIVDFMTEPASNF